jgi:hypothetical protein
MKTRVFVFFLLSLRGMGATHPRDHHPSVSLADYTGLPKVEIGGRVLDLFSGEHFDIALRDTPDEMRPPALVAFHGYKECPGEFSALHFRHVAETQLPSRERLLIAMYDMDAVQKRLWYEWVPERDLVKRFNVTRCPTLAFVPRKCNGWTKWCERSREGDLAIMGCEDFVEQCSGVEHWDGTGSWVDWVQELIKREGEPEISPILGSYAEQEAWHRARDECTLQEQTRMVFFPPVTPGFSPLGYKAMPTPPEMQTWLLDFFQKYSKSGRMKLESWDAGLTQNSFHETPMFQVDLDLEYSKKTEMGDRYLRPLLEEWCGLKDLEVTSIYGIREYHEGHWLANHIDRESTHVISATFSVAKLPSLNVTTPNEKAWPLEFVDWNGQTVRYSHPPGTVVFYESVKGIHGRPFRNPVEGGYHLGAFFHYRPPPSWGDWVKTSREISSEVRKHTVTISYRTKPVEEPENPVYTTFPYGEGAVPLKGDGSMSVTFTNLYTKPLQLFWKDTSDGGGVLQCRVAPGRKCDVQSREGHQFFWSLSDNPQWREFGDKISPPPPVIKGGTTTMIHGIYTYKFSSKDEL